MREFYDEEIALTFRGYTHNDFNTSEVADLYRTYLLQLNEWSSDSGVQNYICKDMELGAFLGIITKHSTSSKRINNFEHFIILDKDTLVGTALIVVNDRDFKEHLIKTPHFDSINTDNNPNLIIEYLVTNPHLRNKGYGTRIVKGIQNNEQLIEKGTTHSGIFTTIDNCNECSKRAFLKNKFVCIPAKAFNDLSDKFSVYYFGKHNKTFEKID